MRRVILGISGALVALLVSGDQGPSRAMRVADPAALLPRLEREIAAREYEATPNAEDLRDPNRAQGLRTYFDSSGIRVLDRMAAASAPELAGLTLDGVDRGDALEEPAAGEVSHDAARVEIRRPGLTEWYVNAPAGLEQGFAVGTRPERGGGSSGLALGTDIRTSGTSPDSDLDTIADAADNCRYRANSGQEDSGGFGAASPPDGVGDACQCGDITGSVGHVDAADVLAFRQTLASGLPFTGTALTRCRVFSGGTACNVLQLSVLRRALHVPALAPLTAPSAAQVCLAALP